MNGKSGSLRALVAGLITTLTLVLVACANEDDNQPGFAEVTPTEGPTSTPTAIPTPTPEAVPLIPLQERPDKRTAVKDAGPIAAEPYRVHTGDGDCLNVRPSPGTSFATDPRTCVPEGFLLWLYGDPVDVDGLTWRYALGEGWVATQYIRADPSATNILATRVPSFVVVVQDGVEEHYSRIDPSGKVTTLASLPVNGATFLFQGDGSSPAMAATQVHGPEAYVVVTWLDSGKQERLDRTRALGWSEHGLLIAIRSDANGENLAAIRPGGATTLLGQQVSGMNSFTVGKNSVIASAEANAIYEFPLSGSGPILRLPKESARNYFGEVSISPDGIRILGSPYIGPIQILSLTNTTLTEFPRAPQKLDLGGRCGRASGRLSTWLDNSTIAWHESYAEKGYNGITIGDLKTNRRTLVPFFTLQNLSAVDDRTLTFSTFEYVEKESFYVTWVLDIVSGEARPVTFGSTTPNRGV